MRVVVVIPALNAQQTIGAVVHSVVDASGNPATSPVVVVDDGSADGTAREAESAGARVVRHQANRGKGVALRSGFREAERLGAVCAVTLDADGQHLAQDAVRLARHPASEDALVLGVRDMARAGAPRANVFSNRLSNFFLSTFSGQELRDTQCGLRRYPLGRVLVCGARSNGFAYESEVVLIAALRGWDIEHVPVQVHYPPEAERSTHFRNVVDPTRIVVAVVGTLTRHVARSLVGGG